MAADTIITNTPNPNNGDSSAGWMVALVIVLAIAVGGVVLYKKGFFDRTPPADTTNINVTIPTGQGTGNENPAE